ncbi:ZIP family metal transporter [candidate division KSB1 bacterium]|nr:ZIP family metal transporter [candidate division KSB1 bacterium]NIR69733.1 ZIP family metal transporter [candidate division KSB1 bacterium]NIS22921.1 ZIP family metal transporter [candidate division KSB1 bacterium]NIT69778.1 ZIP family metal transporter [candidate division KSB1 bacterium]NIU23452.1 ZIP family metal transporter [candidate division KSB1 bacterium]
MEKYQLIFWTTTTGVLSAVATGLGAIPVAYIRQGPKIVRAFSGAVAAGMMISASVFSLAQEGISLKVERPTAPYEVIIGLMLGAAFFWYVDKYFSESDFKFVNSAKNSTSQRRGFLIFLAMFIHSFPEGVAIGVGFGTGDFNFGLIMALAISVHNIPEGIAISLPLRAEGESFLKCFFLSILSSVPQPLAAVPSGLAVWFFKPLLAMGLGFAGGAMIYLVVLELIPEALEEGGRSLTAWGVMVGLGGMLLITSLLNLIKV